MTQKANLFKGQKKKKSIPLNRHGKAPVTRKGKKFLKPSKMTKEMDTDRELSKFINHCNEMKAATAANKEGGQLSIVKEPPASTSGSKKTTSLVFMAFGPSYYSYILIRVLYGTTWSDGEAPAALRYYCFYIIVLAMNGTSEAFLHAVATENQLNNSNNSFLI